MGKYTSSSRKIKPSRDSSKLRSVKKKEKTKRNKKKKISRIKDYSDENESSSSDSSLYSSSEDDQRRHKRRSKLSKKRTRKRYSSSESDDDDNDETRLLKKKKRSKRKHEHVGKKKKKVGSRKKRKRDSSSSFSSESESIRDYQSDGCGEDEDKGRHGKLKAMRRSKNVSEEDNEPLEDEVMTERNSRRLKSVIVVPDTYDNDDERREEMVHDYDDQKNSDDERYCEAITLETSELSPPETSLKNDDLEAILKKRALENLKRFRGKTQKSGIVASKEVSSVLEDEPPLQIEGQESQDNDNVKESGTVHADLASQQPGDTDRVKTRQKLRRPVLGQDSLNLASSKEVVGCKDIEPESINDNTIDKNGAENSLVTEQLISHDDIETKEIKGESRAEEKPMDETKEESQFEQKTMTVMKDGELVQVSYKVYIPKKTSSLGRRKLKR